MWLAAAAWPAAVRPARWIGSFLWKEGDMRTIGRDSHLARPIEQGDPVGGQVGVVLFGGLLMELTREHAAATATSWREGLAAAGIDGARIARLQERTDLAIYTPGSNAGLQLSVLKSFDAPGAAVLADEELLRERIASTVTGLLGLVGLGVYLGLARLARDMKRVGVLLEPRGLAEKPSTQHHQQ